MTHAPFRPGEPLRASDLSAVAAAAAESRIHAAGFLSFQNGSETVVRNPRRQRPSKASAIRVRPFACRLAADTADGAGEGTKALFCYLPPETAGAVRFRGAIVEPDLAIGTPQEPWVRLGPAAEFDELYLAITFETFEREGADGVMETDFRATGWTLSTSAESTPLRWPHLVWAFKDGLGAVQYHLGSVSLGDPAAGEAEQPEADDCTAADDEDFPSRIDETATGPSGTAEGRTHVTGDGGLPSEGDGAVFPSKVDVCW